MIEKQVKKYDALLVVSFGGPEGMDEVMDFLHRVVKGRGVPEERLQKTAEHYYQRGGISPICELNRKLVLDLQSALKETPMNMPVYLGNRNSSPFILEALEEIHNAGHKNILAFVTSAFGSYSGCRQYIQNIEDARMEFTEKTGEQAPAVKKLRLFHNHPLFVEIMSEHTADKLKQLQSKETCVLFSAHSLPLNMAERCSYENQLREVSGLVMSQAISLLGNSPGDNGTPEEIPWRLVYQSVSGKPQDWLGPEIEAELDNLKKEGFDSVVVCPIGFVSDHMEVVHDLDTQAAAHADQLGLNWARTATAQEDERFTAMILELIKEEVEPSFEPRAIGKAPGQCPPGCCE